MAQAMTVTAARSFLKLSLCELFRHSRFQHIIFIDLTSIAGSSFIHAAMITATHFWSILGRGWKAHAFLT